MILYLTLGCCALAAAALVYRYDMYDREPWPVLALAFGLGLTVMALLGRSEAATVSAWPALGSPGGLSLVAALQEEVGKLAVVLIIAVVARAAFNDPMDGLIYGSMAGLGMAVEESVSSLRGAPPQGGLLPGAELVRILGHLVMGGIGGFGLGLARRRLPGWLAALLGCLAAAIGLHFLWDWVALWAAPRSLRAWQAAGAVALMLGGFALYGALVALGSEYSRRAFAPRSLASLWGWPFRASARR